LVGWLLLHLLLGLSVLLLSVLGLLSVLLLLLLWGSAHGLLLLLVTVAATAHHRADGLVSDGTADTHSGTSGHSATETAHHAATLLSRGVLLGSAGAGAWCTTVVVMVDLLSGSRGCLLSWWW
jgi:hypothetical protein